jgi:hypothetical protein
VSLSYLTPIFLVENHRIAYQTSAAVKKGDVNMYLSLKEITSSGKYVGKTCEVIQNAYQLRLCDGQERTEADYDQLLKDAEFLKPGLIKQWSKKHLAPDLAPGYRKFLQAGMALNIANMELLFVRLKTVSKSVVSLDTPNDLLTWCSSAVLFEYVHPQEEVLQCDFCKFPTAWSKEGR